MEIETVKRPSSKLGVLDYYQFWKLRSLYIHLEQYRKPKFHVNRMGSQTSCDLRFFVRWTDASNRYDSHEVSFTPKQNTVPTYSQTTPSFATQLVARLCSELFPDV